MSRATGWRPDVLLTQRDDLSAAYYQQMREGGAATG